MKKLPIILFVLGCLLFAYACSDDGNDEQKMKATTRPAEGSEEGGTRLRDSGMTSKQKNMLVRIVVAAVLSAAKAKLLPPITIVNIMARVNNKLKNFFIFTPHPSPSVTHLPLEGKAIQKSPIGAGTAPIRLLYKT